MYKTFAPLAIQTITDESLSKYIQFIKKGKIERVYLCGFDYIFFEDSPVFTEPERIEKIIGYFKSNGLEVGVWISSFGHGGPLAHEKDIYQKRFNCMSGVLGDENKYSFCPLDENYTEAYQKGIRRIARMKPDIIMLDDDFRLNMRDYNMGCMCNMHLNEFYGRVGEVIPREKIEEKVFSGGKNKYRSAFMDMSAKTLLDFAGKLRETVDEVDDTIRLGACTVCDNWDFCGTDALEIARAFAGNTKPFIRTIGAPYWAKMIPNRKLSDVIEDTRMQINWCKNTDIEVFSECDSYPRARYNVPSNMLELYDIALIADGSADGILKYMFDYTYDVDYEKGYILNHIKNEQLRNDIKDIFHDKTPVGIRAYNVMHKIENWELPQHAERGIASKLVSTYSSTSQRILSQNSIPTSYDDSGYPILLCGENARYITEKDLKNGAVLDICAAKILMESGIDTGLIAYGDRDCVSEYFVDYKAEAVNIDTGALKKAECSSKAKVMSVFTPDDTPAAYCYENEKGNRFFVLCMDLYASDYNINYFNNYYRQQQLVDALEWAGRKKLPVKCLKNPFLYVLASKDNDSMSVLLENIFEDEISNPRIELDKDYTQIKFVNCSGKLDGNIVYLSDIPPFGAAGFEVK